MHHDPPGGCAARRPLTATELRVLRAVADGDTNGAIGRRYRLSEDTVKSQLKRAFLKLGARDRAHAVDLGWRLGLLGVDR